ncbi:acyltransferase 3 [Trichoderma chlorosporum]
MTRAVWLDGLRGIAAAIVATDHYFMGAVLHAGFRSFWADPPEENRKLMQLPPFRLIFAAHAMVPLFFVISGYAISINLIRLRTSSNSEGFLRRLSSAVTRRGLRIYLPVLCITVISQILYFLNLFQWQPGDDVVWGRKPWTAPWFHVTFVVRYMLDNINILAIQYNGGLNGQLWTMALEFRGSCVVYFSLLGLAFWKPMPRLWALVASMVFWFYFGSWDVAGFLAGYWLAEVEVLSESHTVSTKAEYLSWLKPYIPVRARSLNFSAIQTYVVFAIGIWFISLSDDGALPPGYQFLQIVEPSRWDGNWGIIDKSWKTVGSVMVVSAINNTKQLQAPLNSKLVQYLGRISFSLYLVHQTVYHLLSDPVRGTLWYIATGGTDPDPTTGIHKFATAFCWIGGYIILSTVNLYAANLYTRFVDERCITLAKQFDQWVSQ